VLGESKFRSGRHEEAERVLAGLVPLCATDTELALVTNARAYNFSNLMGDPAAAAAAAVLDQALDVISSGAERLRLLGRLATNRIFEGEPEAALAAAEELLASSDDQVVSRGAYTSSIALALLGRGDEAVAVAHRGLEAHRRSTAGNQLPEAQLVGAVLGHAAVGRLDQAEADAAVGYQACLAAGDKEGQATFSFLRGCVLVERGQLVRAARVFREGASINRELHDTGGLRWCTGGLALAEGMAGHAGPALAAVKVLDELPAGWMTIFEPDLVDRGRAWTSVAAGELTRACDTLRDAARRAETVHQRVAEAHLLDDIARLGQASSVTPRLAALAKIVVGTSSRRWQTTLAPWHGGRPGTSRRQRWPSTPWERLCWRPRPASPPPPFTGPKVPPGAPALLPAEPKSCLPPAGTSARPALYAAMAPSR
jgi:hypothetical protein